AAFRAEAALGQSFFRAPERANTRGQRERAEATSGRFGSGGGAGHSEREQRRADAGGLRRHQDHPFQAADRGARPRDAARVEAVQADLGADGDEHLRLDESDARGSGGAEDRGEARLPPRDQASRRRRGPAGGEGKGEGEKEAGGGRDQEPRAPASG